MNDPGQPGPAPATSNIPLVFFAAALVCCVVASNYLPDLATAALSWAVILGFSFAMAVWNRRPAGWAAFWLMVALLVVRVVLQLAGVFSYRLTSAGVVIGGGIVLLCWWLLRMGRLHVAEPVRQEVHHYHHVVGHTELPQTVTAEVQPWARRVIPGATVPALPAPRAALTAPRTALTAARRAVHRPAGR